MIDLVQVPTKAEAGKSDPQPTSYSNNLIVENCNPSNAYNALVFACRDRPAVS